MGYNAKGQKKYNSNSTFFHIKFTPKEINEAIRIKSYLTTTGQSANSYIKSLIKADLDAKGIGYPEPDHVQDSD